METKSIPIVFANTGIVLRSAADEIPITAYKALVNVITDRENSISVRRGFTRLNDGLDAVPCASYFLSSGGNTYRYAVADRKLWAADVSPTISDFGVVEGSTDTPGNPNATGLMSDADDPRPLSVNYTLTGTEAEPYIFLADGDVFWKHKGGSSATTLVRRVGIPAPAQAPTVSLETNAYDMIEDCEDDELWDSDDVNASIDGTTRSTSNAIKVTVSGASASGSAYKALSTIGYPTVYSIGDKDNLDEVIELWIKFPDASDSLNCSELIVSFNLSDTPGNTEFLTRYEKAISPSSLESASQYESTYSKSVPQIASDYDYSRMVDTYNKMGNKGSGVMGSLWEKGRAQLSEQIRIQQLLRGTPTALGSGYGVWNPIRIKKSEFIRVGESDVSRPDLNWGTVTAIKFTVMTGASASSVSAEFDDVQLIVDGKLFGVDLQWAFTYYDTKTGTESDLSPTVSVPQPGANYSQYRLIFPQCPPTDPPAPAPDLIRIYRMGGTIQQLQLVKSIAYNATPMTNVQTVDNIPDSELDIVADLDNQAPPDGAQGVELYENRLWIWGCTNDAPNVIRFSKATEVEIFPTNNIVYVGTGSEKVVRLLEHDGELFAFTLTRVYRITGSSGYYNASATAVNQGLKSKHGLCRGLRSLYMHAYDGIYEFPSGRKISEPINQVFFGETVNEISPIAPGMETYSAMAFWDSKVYFSYSASMHPEITNDRMLVWDTIYERWHWYLYGAQSLYMEPSNNILVGCNLVQWDSIKNGKAYNFTYSGNWPMVLENGFVDVLQNKTTQEDEIRGIFWAVDTREFDLGMPDQEKRFIDFVVDADTQGWAVNFQAAFDPKGDNEHETVGYVNTTGRQQVILPCSLGQGDSRLARRVQLRFLSNTSPTATSVTRLYKVIHRILIEPPRHRTFVTEWSDYGSPGPKFFRELWVELDTFDVALDRIEVQVDQTTVYEIEANTKCNGQTKFYYGLPPDLRGTLARLKIVPQADYEVKLYSHNLQVMPEPACVNTIQTPYTQEGWPYRKLWKEVVLDVDTSGKIIPFHFWLDGQIKQTFDVQTEYRQLVTKSLDVDSIGKLGRVTVAEEFLDIDECCLPICLRHYNTSYVIDKLPADVTIADSYHQDMSFDRFKVIRRFWISVNNPDCDVNMEVWADGNLKTTKTIKRSTLSTGYSKRRITLKSAVKGKLFRIKFTGPFPFEIWWDKSEFEGKNINSEDGYQRMKLQPPQTM